MIEVPVKVLALEPDGDAANALALGLADFIFSVTAQGENVASTHATSTSPRAAGILSRYSGEAYHAVDWYPDGETAPVLAYALLIAYIALLALVVAL